MTVLDLDLRRVYGAYPTGVAVLAGLVDDQPAGIAASSFVPVSLEPPLVSVCVAHTSSTWPRLSGLPRIGISILGADQGELARQLGAKTGDRFAGLAWRTSVDRSVHLENAAAWFDCSIERCVRAGDHDIVLLRVHDLDASADIAPLIFHASTYRTLA